VTEGTTEHALRTWNNVTQRSRRWFDRWAVFCDRRAALLFMAVWAFAESLVWPIIPDFLLVLLAIGRPRRSHYSLAACVAGSAVGASLLYGLAWSRPGEAARVLPSLPLIFEADIVVTRERIAQDGAFAFLGQPVSGIPFKVWGIVGAISGVPPVVALPVAILARAARMTLVSTAAAFLGARFGGFVRDHWLMLLIVYVTIFVLGWVRTFPVGR
jgi:membrane protein YqaA with SNARE-associated domain